MRVTMSGLFCGWMNGCANLPKLSSMHRSWFLAGTGLYLLLLLAVFPFMIGVPVHLMFDSDAGAYSRGAVNLLLHGFYSFDGQLPFFDREPGMSFFLVPVYAVFGIENPVGVAAAQSVLLFLAAWFFCGQIARTYGSRVAGICFLLLLTSGSVFHTIFSAYRECLALVLLMTFAVISLSQAGTHSTHSIHSGQAGSVQVPATEKIILMGLVLGFLILTSYAFIFLPVALVIVWVIQKRRWREILLILFVCYGLVSVWALRNFSYDGRFRVIDDHRTAVMWYVRGEQANRVQGLEPLRCLWAEYVSRDWTGRSDACSYNSVMHRRWPEGFVVTDSDSQDARQTGQANVRAHLLSYLNFSLTEILELHLPFVGGGWSTAFNVYAAFTGLILAIGFLLGLPALFKPEYLLWLMIIAYNTSVFSLPDATPR